MTEKQTYRAVIEWLDAKTGKTGTYVEGPREHGSLWNEDEWGNDTRISVFQWTDGNYGCDCNRSIFFLGLDYDHHEPCGSRRGRIKNATRLTRAESVSN